MKLLFICEANQNRSRTAEMMYATRPGYEARSAGFSTSNGARLISEALIQWATIVLVMEEKHGQSITAMWPKYRHKIKVLGVPDLYNFDTPELRCVLDRKIEEVINSLIA